MSENRGDIDEKIDAAYDSAAESTHGSSSRSLGPNNDDIISVSRVSLCEQCQNSTLERKSSRRSTASGQTSIKSEKRTSVSNDHSKEANPVSLQVNKLPSASHQAYSVGNSHAPRPTTSSQLQKSGKKTETLVVTVPPAPQRVIIANRSLCSNCRTGVIMEEYTCLGLLMAIVFFPVGLLCCYFLRQRICTTCGVVYPRNTTF